MNDPRFQSNYDRLEFNLNHTSGMKRSRLLELVDKLSKEIKRVVSDIVKEVHEKLNESHDKVSIPMGLLSWTECSVDKINFLQKLVFKSDGTCSIFGSGTTAIKKKRILIGTRDYSPKEIVDFLRMEYVPGSVENDIYCPFQFAKTGLGLMVDRPILLPEWEESSVPVDIKPLSSDIDEKIKLVILKHIEEEVDEDVIFSPVLDGTFTGDVSDMSSLSTADEIFRDIDNIGLRPTVPDSLEFKKNGKVRAISFPLRMPVSPLSENGKDPVIWQTEP